MFHFSTPKILEESHRQGQKLYRPKFLLQESKMIIEAYRREKQKAEVGAQDPAETSWKLIKEKVQTRFTAEIVFRVFD